MEDAEPNKFAFNIEVLTKDDLKKTLEFIKSSGIKPI